MLNLKKFGKYGILLTISTLSATRTYAWLPSAHFAMITRRNLVCRPSVILRMSARDDEIRRLREENEQLRRKLERSEGSDSFSLSSLTSNIAGALSSALKPFAKVAKPQTVSKVSETDTLLDQMFKDAPLPVRVFGGLFKGVAGLATEAMKSAASDIDRIKDMVKRTVSMDPEIVKELGGEIDLEAPFSQSFSSSSINGRTSKRVALQMPIRGRRSSVCLNLDVLRVWTSFDVHGQGVVAVDASIDEQNVVELSRCSVQANSLDSVFYVFVLLISRVVTGGKEGDRSR